MRRLYIFILLICSLSCSKEEGAIPTANLWDEHYTNVNPKLLWERNCSTADDAEITSMGVVGDKVFVFLSNETMRIYNSTNAQLINEDAHDGIFDYKSISDFELRERGSSIYVIDKNNYQIIQVDKASGSISDIFAPSLSDNIRQSFGMEIMEDNIYFFKYDATNQYSFVKYNFFFKSSRKSLVNPA